MEEIYNFITKRLSESYKPEDWRKDTPYKGRPFDMKGLKSEDIEDMIDFNVGVEMGHPDEPPFTLVLLKNKKVLFVWTSYSLPPNHYVLGERDWVYGNQLTKTQLKKFMR